MKSTSGGVFQIVAHQFLRKGGIVFGAAFDENLSVCYKKIESVEELPSILGSKYVEAALNDTFDKVVACLSERKKVLFIGSPCVVNALKQFVSSRNDTSDELLYLIDFVCSGVPEKGLWEAYLNFLHGKLKELHQATELKMTRFTFRDKTRPDSAHMVSWEYDIFPENGASPEHRRGECAFMEDRYCRIYAKNVSLQQRCLKCKWCSLNRPGDMSIGDYWGVEKYHPEFDDGYGVSLCISNNGKGDSMVAEIAGEVESIELHEDEIIQPRLKEPNKPTILNVLFQKDLYLNGKAEDCDIEMIVKKYGA